MGICSCLFWGICHHLDGHGLWLALGVSPCPIVITCGHGNVVSALSSVMIVLSCGLLVGQALCAYQSTMTNDRFKFIIHHLVTTSLSVTWHLKCVSVTGGQGVMMLGVITIRQRHVMGVVG